MPRGSGLAVCHFSCDFVVFVHTLVFFEYLFIQQMRDHRASMSDDRGLWVISLALFSSLALLCLIESHVAGTTGHAALSERDLLSLGSSPISVGTCSGTVSLLLVHVANFVSPVSWRL